MTRDEGTSASYQKHPVRPVPAGLAAKVQAALSDRKPRVTSNGLSVREISMDSRRTYQIKRGPYFVSLARNIPEVAQYVDLDELLEGR